MCTSHLNLPEFTLNFSVEFLIKFGHVVNGGSKLHKVGTIRSTKAEFIFYNIMNQFYAKKDAIVSTHIKIGS